MVLPKDKKIWTDWEWIEPPFAYELSELTHYFFKRYVGEVIDGSFVACEEIRIVPVKNF